MLTIDIFEDAIRVSSRLWNTYHIDIPSRAFVLDGREELTPEHEGDIIAEYGYDALVRYYAPKDPRLAPLEAV